MDIILTGTITTDLTSPLATKPMPIPNEKDAQSKYLEGGSNTSRLPRLLLPVAEGAEERMWSAYFPASGLRGALRRCGRDAFHAHYGHGWNVDTHRYITIGGVMSSGTQANFNLIKAQALRKNLPFISLFGATADMGHSWVSGKLGISPAVPSTPLQPQIISGVRTDDLARHPEEIRYLDDASTQALTGRTNAERQATALRRDLKAKQRDLAAAKRSKDPEALAAAESAINDLETRIEQVSEVVGRNVSVQMPLDGYEAIPPGTALTQRITLHNVTEAEAGLFFLALGAFADQPYLGAHASQGCGLVHGQWSVRLREAFGSPYKHIGTCKFSPYEDVNYGGEQLKTLVGACQEAFVKSVHNLNGDILSAIQAKA